MRRSAMALLPLCCPVVAAAQDAREFGAARFAAPPGFTIDSRPTVLGYARVRGRELCMIVVYRDEVSAPAPETAFADAWGNVFNAASYRRADRPPARLAVSPAGNRYAFGEGDLEDRGGNRFIARLHIFPVAGKTQAIAWIANGREAMDGCAPDWTSFFASLRFPKAEVVSAAGAPAPDRPAATVPAVPDAPAPVPADPSTPATPQQFDNVTFLPPPGWTVRRAPDGVHLAPAGARPGEWLQVSLLKGSPASSSLPGDFAAAWGELGAMLGAQLMRSVNGGNYDLDEPTRSLRGWDYIHGNGGMKRGGADYSVDLYLIRSPDRLARVVVLSRDFRENSSGGVMQTSSRNPAWDRAIREFIFRLRFAGQSEAPLTPARIGTTTISGVWNGIAMSFGRLKTQFAIFFDNGVAYFGPMFPLRGLNEIDPAVEQPAARRYWGTWTFAGGRGVLSMPYGIVPLLADGPVLVLTTNQTPHRFIRRLVPANPRLDGTWCLGGGPCLTLTAAGRFQDGGAVRAIEHAVYAYPESPARGEGRYRIVDYTLILQYDGGPEMRFAFPGLTENPSASPANLTLGFNEDVLTRR